MRTTINLPDALLREIKAKAALDGVTLSALMLNLVESGLRSTNEPCGKLNARSRLPTLDIKKPIAKLDFSNAGLFDVVND